MAKVIDPNCYYACGNNSSASKITDLNLKATAGRRGRIGPQCGE